MPAAPSGRVALLVTSSPDQAEQWAAVLDRAGIDVLVEITDAVYVEPGRSALIGVLGAAPMKFVHVLTLDPSDRERAVAALIDAGWDGREGLVPGPTPAVRVTWRTVALAVGAVAAFAILVRVLA